MGRPRTKPAVTPSGFNLKKYDCTGLDGADWLLNLSLRNWLRRQSSEEVIQYVREKWNETPVLRRAVLRDGQYLEWDCEVDDSLFSYVIHGNRPQLGVNLLCISELYTFEQRLPQKIRDFAATYVPEYNPIVPPGFTDAVDRAMPERLLSCFARINLSLPDDVLLEDFSIFLREYRQELKALAPQAPYLEAIRSANRSDIARWAKQNLLAFIDLVDTNPEAPNSAFCIPLGIDDKAVARLRQLHRRLSAHFCLKATLHRAARIAILKDRFSANSS